VAHGDAREGK